MMKKSKKIIAHSHSKQLLLGGLILLMGVFLMNLSSAFDWNNNIVAYYTADDTVGNILDITGVHNGSSFNITRGVPGILSTSYRFDGLTSYGNLTKLTDLEDTASISINLWVNRSIGIVTPTQGLIRGSNGITILQRVNGSYSCQKVGITDTGNTVIGLNDSKWHMISCIYNGTGLGIYVDGILNNSAVLTGNTPADWGNITLGADSPTSQFWKGELDEIGFWNRSLSQADLTELYNSGNGLAHPGSSGGNVVTLISPSNDSKISTSGANFTAYFNLTSNPNNYEWKNATFNIWLSNSTLFNQTYITLSGNHTYNITFIDDFIADNYLWNVLGCYGNVSFNNCTFSNNNNTFSVTGFTVNSEKWTNVTTPGSIELFQINLTLTFGFQISTGQLIYNGTPYSGTFTNLGGGSYSVNKYITIPGVTANSNATFYWSFLLNNGFTTNTTEHNQSINVVNIDDCSAYSNLIINYSLLDEELRTSLGATQNASIKVDALFYSADMNTLIFNYSKEYTNVPSASICIDNSLENSTLSLFTTALYSATGYVPEFHHIQNYALTNSTLGMKVDLHDLNATDSTDFLITFKDNSFLAVPNALIDITRKYVGEGLFRSVEIPKTDKNGQTVGHFDTSGVAYTILVKKNGVILATFDNVAVVCQNAVIGECNLNLNAFTGGESFTDWATKDNLNYVFSFNEATKTVSVTFSTTDSSTATMILNTTKFDRFQNTSVCSDILTSSSGTLTCVVPDSYGNITIVSELYKNGNLVTTRTFTISPLASDTFGTAGFLFVIILMITLPLMFAGDKIGMIIGSIIGLIFCGLLFVYNSGSFFGPTSAIIWFIVAGGILIWKVSQTE